jgi:HSP20 family molecular chaperone IbpA
MANEARTRELPEVRPAADIVQKDDSHYIIMDMPGMRKEDLDISINENVLTVQGSTSHSMPDQERVMENEFGNVHYTRKFTLSDTVDTERINASLKNGVLRLHLPRKEELQPKKIQIEQG